MARKYPQTPAVRVTGKAFRLDEVNPGASTPFAQKYTGGDEARPRLLALRKRLCELQELLYAEHSRSLLIVLQAMDTGGKDGLIENLLTGVNPAGVQVATFKAPSTEELNHDFLWRIHAHTPKRGNIGVFNRSHYEDVLITRVHELIDKKTCTRHYDDINNFEELLTRNGTHILKFFLHISKDEQASRLQARLDDPSKNWKFDPNDLKERVNWSKYQHAYEDAVRHCSPDHAPWFVVPANHKWARDLAVTELVVAELEAMKIKPPTIDFDPQKIVIV